jgi:hypothetical protein
MIRTYNAILLVALISLSFSNAFEFTNLQEVKDLRTNSYGNSLIETISLTLQSTGSIKDVQKLLDDLLFQLNADQEAADKKWKEEEAKLKAKEEQLKSEIEELRKTIALKEGQLKALEEKIATAITNLAQYSAQLVADQKNLVALDAQREKDKTESAQSVRDHNDVINAISAVVAELSKLKGSVSGQDKPAHVEEIEQEKRDREYKLQKSFLQINRDETEALLFAQLATTADQAALQKLIDLLNQLSENTKKSMNDDAEQEEKSKKTYETLKVTINADIANLTKNIKEQTENKKKYEEEAAKLKKEIEEHKVLKKSKEDELAATTKERLQKEQQYLHDKAERANEKLVIQKLQKIVEERLANMSKFLKDKTGAF